jgi:hypothetical protein
MYGRAGELARLNNDRNDPKLSKFVRQQADKAHQKIVNQLKDRKLMGLRERLIRATQAGDQYEARKIETEMRAYTGEDRETGT